MSSTSSNIENVVTIANHTIATSSVTTITVERDLDEPLPGGSETIKEKVVLPRSTCFGMWLLEQVSSGLYAGLEWLDDKKTYFKIPWTKVRYPQWQEHHEIFKVGFFNEICS